MAGPFFVSGDFMMGHDISFVGLKAGGWVGSYVVVGGWVGGWVGVRRWPFYIACNVFSPRVSQRVGNP